MLNCWIVASTFTFNILWCYNLLLNCNMGSDSEEVAACSSFNLALALIMFVCEWSVDTSYEAHTYIKSEYTSECFWYLRRKYVMRQQ